MSRRVGLAGPVSRSTHSIPPSRLQAADEIRQGIPGSAERLRSQVAQLREGAEMVLRGTLAAAQVRLNALEADLIESDLLRTQRKFARVGTSASSEETPKKGWWRPGWL